MGEFKCDEKISAHLMSVDRVCPGDIPSLESMNDGGFDVMYATDAHNHVTYGFLYATFRQVTIAVAHESGAPHLLSVGSDVAFVFQQELEEAGGHPALPHHQNLRGKRKKK